MRGGQVIRRLRAQGLSDAPVILISGRPAARAARQPRGVPDPAQALRAQPAAWGRAAEPV